MGDDRRRLGAGDSLLSTQHSVLDYLVVGHVTRDLLPGGGFAFGGTASYGSLTACRLGHRAAVVTAAEPTEALFQFLDGVAVHCTPAPATTTFKNRYHGGQRTQCLCALAPPLQPEAIPAAWRATPVVHLGPVAQEIPAELVGIFAPDVVLGVTPQGWLRTWDADGRVRSAPWADAEAVLERAAVLVFSEHDVGGDRAAARRFIQMARVAVVTHGGCGATVYWNRGAHQRSLPAFPAREIDPTGAGDVFATAFLLRYHRTADPVEAARYANCVASFVVEGPGTSTLPSPEQVEARRGEASTEY